MGVRNYTFSQRTVHEWNTLSADCVHSSSIDTCKNIIDNHLVRVGYTLYVWTLDKSTAVLPAAITADARMAILLKIV